MMSSMLALTTVLGVTNVVTNSNIVKAATDTARVKVLREYNGQPIGYKMNFDADGVVKTNARSVFSGFDVDGRPDDWFFCVQPFNHANDVEQITGDVRLEDVVGESTTRTLNIGAYILEMDRRGDTDYVIQDLRGNDEAIRAAMQMWASTKLGGRLEDGNGVVSPANDNGTGIVFQKNRDYFEVSIYRDWYTGGETGRASSTHTVETGKFETSSGIVGFPARTRAYPRGIFDTQAEAEAYGVQQLLALGEPAPHTPFVTKHEEEQTNPNTFLRDETRYNEGTTRYITSPKFIRDFIARMDRRVARMEKQINRIGITITPDYQKGLIGSVLTYNVTGTGDLSAADYLAETTYPKARPNTPNIDTTGDNVNDTYLWVEGETIKVEGTAMSKDGRFTWVMDGVVKPFEYPQSRSNRFAVQMRQILTPLDASQVYHYTNRLEFDVEFIKNGHIRFNKASTDDRLIPDLVKAQGTVFKLFKDEALQQEVTQNNAQPAVAINGTVNQNGIVEFRDLLAVDTQTGQSLTYYIKEFSTVAPFLLNTKVYKATLIPNETVGIVELNGTNINDTVQNDVEYGKLTLIKVDSETGHPQGNGTLEGAKYRVELVGGPYHKQGTTHVEEVTTIKNGDRYEATTTNRLPLGEYVITETQAPTGYRLNPNPVRVTIEYTNATTPVTLKSQQVVEDVQRGEIELTKLVEKLEDTLNLNSGEINTEQGVKFDITNISTNPVKVDGTVYPVNEVVQTLTTNDKGYAKSSKLPYGLYRVSQQKGGTQEIAPFEVFVSQDQDNQVHSFVYKNTTKISYLQLRKTDIETKQTILVKGVSFQIYKEEQGGNPIVLRERAMSHPNGFKDYDTFTTLEDGTVTFPQVLEAGIYYLDEVESPEGYYLDPNGKRIKIEITGTHTIVDLKVERVDVGNDPQKAELTINKVGRVFKGLKDGVVPNGITLKTEQGTLKETVFEKGHLAGAIFEIRAKEAINSYDKQTKFFNENDLVVKIETLSNGNLKVTGRIYKDGALNLSDEVEIEQDKLVLPLGKYTLQEVKAPEGYLLDETVSELEFTPQNRSIKYDKEALTIENVKQKAKITLNKQIEKSIFGYEVGAEQEVVFGLYNTKNIVFNGITVPTNTLLGVTKVTRNDAGELVGQFDTMLAGEYKLVELNTAKEYVLNTNDYNLTFNYDPKGKELVDITYDKPIENNLKRVVVKVVKVDSVDKTPIKEVKFELQYVDKENKTVSLGEHVTNENGEIVIENLEVGNYKLVEVKAAKGYWINEKETNISIPNTIDNKTTITYTKENEKLTVRIHKLDADTKQYLANAQLELIDKATNRVIETWTTTDKPYELVGLLEVGATYILQEKVAPKGYATFKPVEFVVENKALTEITVEDKPIVVEVTKIGIFALEDGSQESKELPGASMRVTEKETGKEIAKWISTDKAYRIKGLEVGKTYTLHEDLAPVGYRLAQSVDFIITDTEEVQKVIMVNELQPEVRTKAQTKDGKKEVVANEKTTLMDYYYYNNVNIENEYFIVARLILKGLDGKVEKELARKEFYHKFSKHSGVLEIYFEDVNTEDLEGRETVVFEKLYKKLPNGELELVHTHEDIEDKDQTVKILPKPIRKIDTSDTTSNTNEWVAGISILMLLGVSLFKISRKED